MPRHRPLPGTRSALVPAFTLLASLAAPAATAQDYPARPIRYVVAFAPGGINDILARVVGQKLSESWGQPVIVDNRPGAGGNLAAEMVSRSTADGYTIMNISTAHTIAQTLYPKLGYSLAKDLAPIVLLGTSPLMMAVFPGLPVKSVPELIAWAKSNRLIYASGGVGVISHLSMEMFKVATKVDATHVPYKGAGPASGDLMGGQVHVMCNAIPELFPFAKGGKLRVIGMLTEKRHPMVPEVPTFAEQGLKDFVMGNWAGIVAPAGVPKPIQAKLAQEISRIVQSPDVHKRLSDLGFDPMGSDPAQFGALIQRETVRFGAAVKASGARVD